MIRFVRALSPGRRAVRKCLFRGRVRSSHCVVFFSSGEGMTYELTDGIQAYFMLISCLSYYKSPLYLLGNARIGCYVDIFIDKHLRRCRTSEVR